MDFLVMGMVRNEPRLVVGLVDTEMVERARTIHDVHASIS